MTRQKNTTKQPNTQNTPAGHARVHGKDSLITWVSVNDWSGQRKADALKHLFGKAMSK